MQRKRVNYWQKALNIMWHQSNAIGYALLVVLPFCALLTYLYPSYAPLLFLSISINQVSATAYYEILLFGLLTPLILLVVFGLVTLSVGTYLARRETNLMADSKKVLSIIPYTIAGLWTWLFVGWVFSVVVKLLLSFFTLSFSTQNVCSLLGYMAFYVIAMESTRTFSFAVHYHFFEHVGWEKALSKSAALTKSAPFYIRQHDIFATLIHLFVPCLVAVFCLLTARPIHAVLTNTLTRLGVLCFMHLTFSFSIIARALLFMELKHG